VEQRAGVNRPERALGADTVPQRKRKGNREDVYSGQKWYVTARRTKHGKMTIGSIVIWCSMQHLNALYCIASFTMLYSGINNY